MSAPENPPLDRQLDEGWQRLIGGLTSGDELVLHEFYGRYADALEMIVKSRLQQGFQRRFDAEEVVQSTMRTFFRRMQAGHLELDDRQRLWNLLCAITLTKLREKVRFHLRMRRAIDKEQGFVEERNGGNSGTAIADVPDPRAAPDAALEFAETFNKILNSLTSEERSLIELKLQDCTNIEIARALNLSDRSVQRILQRLQSRFETLLGTND